MSTVPRLVAALALVMTAAAGVAGAASEPTEPNEPAAGPVALAGTWTLVSVDNILAPNEAGSERIQPYGDHPDGILMIDARGRYALHIFRAARAKFATGDKARGTAEENLATVRGTNSHFGRLVVDHVADTAGTVTFHIEHASFPNWEGIEQRRQFTLDGDRLRYTVNTTTTGGTEVGEVTWRRLP